MLTKRAEQRNLLCGIVHGAFFHMGTAFADPYAVVPLSDVDCWPGESWRQRPEWW